MRANNQAAAEWFLKNGASAMATDALGQTPLHGAAFRGSPALVNSLIEKGADPNATLPNGPADVSAYGRGVTPLHRAALYGNGPVVIALLKAKADPNALTEGKMTPLHFAAQGGQSEVAKILLQNGADAKIGTPVLLVAAREHRFSSPWSHPIPRPFPTPDRAATIQALLTGGADSATDGQGHNALFAAIAPPSRGDVFDDRFASVRRFREAQETSAERAKMIAALIKGGVSVNARAKVVDTTRMYGPLMHYSEGEVLGPTALHLAVENLDLAAVKALLENGADPSLENGVGRTPMDVAMRRGENSARRLDMPFANGRMTSFSDREKPAPLLLDGSVRREIIALLRKHGGDKIGRGPFLNAIVWGAASWVKNAVAAQGDLVHAVAEYEGSSNHAVVVGTKTTEMGSTAPSLAVSFKHPELARFLIEKGAPIGGTGWGKRNLLFDATFAKDWPLVDLLLAKGLKWEAETSQNHTPLHIVAQSGDLESVKELVKRGVPLDVKDKNGQTALTVAMRNGKTAVAAFLREKGAPE